MSLRWVTAFLDSPAAELDESTAFWAAATGYAVSPARGVDGEFATLQPPDGDAFVKLQRLGSGAARIHLDLHVQSTVDEAHRAVDLGARVVDEPDGYVVLTSPGGLDFCLVPWAGAPWGKPRPTLHDGEHGSRVDQVAIDVPDAAYDRELDFWEHLTGWPARSSSSGYDEFRFLVPPREEQQPLGILLQRLGEADGPARAHLDWGTTNRAAEVARHVGLGATALAEHDMWTVMSDPTGRTYCLTDADPN